MRSTAVNFPLGMNGCMGVTSGACDWPPFLATESVSAVLISSFQSTRVAYSDHSSNPVCGFGSAKQVLSGPNITESNLFRHGETTYKVG